jgi:guanylate kinase
LSERVPNVIVVSAPSGTGKSTVLARVLAELPRLRFSVSHTTRPPRRGETDGVQYHFVGRAGFEEAVRAGRFLEWAEVHGELYGTSRAEYDRAVAEEVDLLLDLDVQGAAQLRMKLDGTVTVFVLPPSFADLERRLRGRAQDDEETVRRRLATAREEVGLYGEYQYTIVNDDLERCVLDLKSIIRAARCRTSGVDGAARRIVATFEPKE